MPHISHQTFDHVANMIKQLLKSWQELTAENESLRREIQQLKEQSMPKPNVKKLQKQCDDFNAKYPVGTTVMLKKDFVDAPVAVNVRHPAYVLSGHSAVAFFEGVSGSYLIDAVKGPA